MNEEKFECERDGLTIRGHVFGRSDVPKPAVICSHGFMGNESETKEYAQKLASDGFVAFTYDFCGGAADSKSDGKTEDMTVFTERRDLESVIAYVKSLPYVQKKHVSLLGCSQGGLVTMMTADQHAAEIESLILLYPAVCIPDDSRRGSMQMYHFDPENIPDLLGEKPMKVSGEYARTAQNIQLEKDTGRFNKPVLYIHGTEDEIVPVSYARKAGRMYQNVKYHEIEGAGHVFYDEAKEQAENLIQNFVQTIRKSSDF